MTDMAAIVAATLHNRGIGCKGQLPWRLPGDMAHFKRVTLASCTDTSNNTTNITAAAAAVTNATTNVVIMGRKTWDSIPQSFKPLAGRINIILSSSSSSSSSSSLETTFSSSPIEGPYWAKSWDDVQVILTSPFMKHQIGKIFVIGGAQVYQQAMEQGFINRVIYTQVLYPDEDPKMESPRFDSFFPPLPQEEWSCYAFDESTTTSPASSVLAESTTAMIHTDESSELQYRFLDYHRKTTTTCKPLQVNTEEMQYLHLCKEIIEQGIQRSDRTGTGTLSKFGTQMRFSLRDGTIPLLTTKRVFWRGVAEELLWFISGNTNANVLASKDIHIWDGNGSREFLDSLGLHHRDVGDLGPVYGFQWRHFGATYTDMYADYTGQGIDQLADCIHKIIHHPTDRRIVLSAWNPADLKHMALPPCHMFCQFFVDIEKNELSCQMYQRSADMGLGVPFNIASYALLTHLIAHVTGRKPGDFIHTIGDAHVYLNHVDALKEQIQRIPRPFPKLVIRCDPDQEDGVTKKKSIDDFVFDDLEIIGYDPHKSIHMKMAV